jgi:hypothetical protein
MLSSICKILGCFPFEEFKVVFHYKNKLRLTSFYKTMHVVFQLQKLLKLSSIYKNKFRSFSMHKTMHVVFHLQKVEVVFHLHKKVMLSSILSLPASILTIKSYFDTPTAGWVGGLPGGRPAYSEIKTNSA